MKQIEVMTYRFGFILTTLLGNEIRYRNIKKYSHLVSDVVCIWAPVRHYYTEDEHNPMKLLPGALQTRAVVIAQAAPVLRQLSSLDAVMVHQFEALNCLAARSYVANNPIVVAAQDLPPVIDRDNYPLYPEQRDKTAWRSSLRLAVDKWALRRAGYFLGFSEWSADIVRQCGLAEQKVTSIHVGIDLDDWKLSAPAADQTDRLQLLFVAGDFARKGGHKVLELFGARLSSVCDLHVVTQTAVTNLPPNVEVHYGLTTGDPRLVALFQKADIFILPTLADLSPWVMLEAMATGCAVAASGIGGIPDMITKETGLLFDPTNDADFACAVETLVNDPVRCRQMGRAGRAHVETHFDARKNVPAIFDQMKRWVDEGRVAAGPAARLKR